MANWILEFAESMRTDGVVLVSGQLNPLIFYPDEYIEAVQARIRFHLE